MGLDFDIRPLEPIYGIAQPFLYFMNTKGDSLSLKVYVDSFRSRNILSLTKDGNNLVATGYITSKELFLFAQENVYLPYTTAFWVAKFDLTGNMLWQKEIPNTSAIQFSSKATRIIPATDGTGYLIAGQQGAFLENKIIVKVDTAGNFLWRKQIKQPIPEYNYYFGKPFDIAPALNGGCFFTASDPYKVYSEFYGDSVHRERIYYGRLNQNGDTLWTKTYVHDTAWGFAVGGGIQVANNGDLIITGLGQSRDHQLGFWFRHAVVLRTDSLGNPIWYREPMHYDFNTTNYNPSHILFGLSLGADGSIAAAGEYLGKAEPSQSAEEVNVYPWLILMDSLGRRCDIDTVTLAAVYPCERIPGADPYLPDTLFTLYPNPTRDKINILMTGTTGYIPIKNKVKMGIFDMSGRQIHQQIIGSEFTTIDISQYPQGMYMVQIWIDKRKAQYWKVAKY